jgi:hypothetical protein
MLGDEEWNFCSKFVIDINFKPDLTKGLTVQSKFDDRKRARVLRFRSGFNLNLPFMSYTHKDSARQPTLNAEPHSCSDLTCEADDGGELYW